MKFGMIVFLLLPFLGGGYVMWHTWRILPIPVWAKVLAMLLMIGAFALFFVALMSMLDTLPMPLATIIYEVGTSWLIVLLYLFIIFLLLDLGRLFHLVPSSLLSNSWRGTMGILIVMLLLFGLGNLNYRHKVRRTLELTTNKPLEKPLKVVMMSDLHLGYHNQRKELARWIDIVNSEHPDLILIVGDIIDRSLRPLKEQRMAEEFKRLEAPVVACLGNHEYYAGEKEALAFYKEAGIILLRDQVLNWGDVCIAGRDDRTNPRRKTVMNLVSNIDRHRYTILLDHQPYHLEHAEKMNVDLQLSGHTHGGQVWPISWITRSLYECAAGEYQRRDTHYFVSSGMGIWGGKYRIGTRSEYVVVTIKPALSDRPDARRRSPNK